MMHKVYNVKVETKDSVIVFEFDKPITMGRLARIIKNNYYGASEIVYIGVSVNTVTDVE